MLNLPFINSLSLRVRNLNTDLTEIVYIGNKNESHTSYNIDILPGSLFKIFPLERGQGSEVDFPIYFNNILHQVLIDQKVENYKINNHILISPQEILINYLKNINFKEVCTYKIKDNNTCSLYINQSRIYSLIAQSERVKEIDFTYKNIKDPIISMFIDSVNKKINKELNVL